MVTPKGNEVISMLPDFYREYGYDSTKQELLYTMFSDIVDVISEYTQTVYKNTFINYAELYRHLGVAVIDMYPGCYDVEKIALAYNAKGKNWSADSVVEKVLYLESIGKFVTVDTKRDWDITSPRLINLEISRDSGGVYGSYTNMVDYVVKEGKLFLFNHLAKLPEGGVQTKRMVCRNVVIDTQKVANRWGTLVGVNNSVLIPESDYKALVIMAMKLLDVGPIISELRKALSSLESLKGTYNVRDSYTKKNIPLSLFKKYGGYPTIKPFDFMVFVPADIAMKYVPDWVLDLPPEDATYRAYMSVHQEKIAILETIIKSIKPIYTRYILSGVWNLEETLDIEEPTKFLITNPLVQEDFSLADAVEDISWIAHNSKGEVVDPALYKNAYDTGLLYDTKDLLYDK